MIDRAAKYAQFANALIKQFGGRAASVAQGQADSATGFEKEAWEDITRLIGELGESNDLRDFDASNAKSLNDNAQ